MSGPILLCTDGSPLAHAALVAGLAVVGTDRPMVLVTVVEEPDPTLVTGTGFAGGVLTPEELDARTASAAAQADVVLTEAAATLGLSGCETRTLRGDAAIAIFDLAEEVGAAGIVIGSRGHGGFRRAVLGSVSDHVVRHAPCPVVITGQHAAES
jgi:nucleotide-binding universal stress UspA family protein